VGAEPGAAGAPPSISVVVCAFTAERLPSMEEAVAALTGAPVRPHEIVLVIDHAPDLLERVTGLWPEVTAIPNDQTQGLSGARNAGVAAATGAVVAFLDDDAIPDRDWVARLGDAYVDPAVLGVGGRVRPRWVAGEPRWFPDEFAWVVGCTHSGMPAAPAPVRNVIGANMSFRRGELLAVGGFRQEFGRIGKNAAGAEETDVCIRIGQNRPDGKILYDPAIAVEHVVPPARGQVSYFLTRCLGEGRSKAALAASVGTEDGLADERSYVRSTLPRGVLRGLGATLRGDLGGAQRAAMILAGLLVTTFGYATGRSRRGVSRPR
jgi:hypothetical protein